MAASSSIASPIVEQRGRGGALAKPSAELTIVVPTFNERENITPLLEKVEEALLDVTWEVVFVDDDSRDGTADAVRAIARCDPRVRCLQRIGRRGLSTACVEGVLASSAPFIAVMDADMQHDERLLPQMLKALKSETCDVAVGSRYVPGGSVEDWDLGRASISGFATRLSRAICRVGIADPMSGFFMVRRDVFEGSMRRLSGQGFKILLDLIASSPETLRVTELPFKFRARQHGTSKLDTLVAWEFVMLLADKFLGSKVPVSFVMGAFITAFCLTLHLGALWVGSHVYGVSPIESETAAVVVSAGAMFFLNQLFTHRDKRLGGARLACRMLLFFVATTAIGSFSINMAPGIFGAWSDGGLATIARALFVTVSGYALARLVSQLRSWKPGSGAVCEQR